jgi:hypothetical protein
MNQPPFAHYYNAEAAQSVGGKTVIFLNATG